jgi:WD40 repeat protein
VAFSPVVAATVAGASGSTGDGSTSASARFATGSLDGQARIWDVDRAAGTVALVLSLDHQATVQSVHFSVDGRRLVTHASGLSRDERIATVWNLEDRTRIHVLQASDEDYHRYYSEHIPEPKYGPAAFSPDGNILVVATNRCVAVYSAAAAAAAAEGKGEGEGEGSTLEKLYTLTHDRFSSHIIYDIAISPNSKLLAYAESWGKVRVWDLEARTTHVLKSDIKADGTFHGIAFSSDGKRVASGAKNGTVLEWDVAAVGTGGVVDGWCAVSHRVRGQDGPPVGRRDRAGVPRPQGPPRECPVAGVRPRRE